MVDFKKMLEKSRKNKKLKIRFCMFEIAKWGGIYNQTNARIEAFRELGHDCDIIMLRYDKNINEKGYTRKLEEIKSGAFQSKLESHSQNGGYEKNCIGYYGNNYYGWLLPPVTNSIPVFHPDALEMWHKAVDDCDIIFWDFFPTKTSEAEGFDFWWKFFDLPSRIKQVFTAHDAYFDMRASWITAIKDKILFLDCCLLTCYKCCANIGMPRNLILAWRKFPEKMYDKPMYKRDVDFFAAHIFKSMKRMEDFLRAIPYLNDSPEHLRSCVIAGAGIEYSYMTSKDKAKEAYKCLPKYDPDLPKSVSPKTTIWNRALEYEMEYAGMIGKSEVDKILTRTKFAVDPSWCKHYAKYCATHINGFTIEAMINGCYPVYRDYRGISKEYDGKDPLFDNIKAIVTPWDATPKQYATDLKRAMRMSDLQFKKDTTHNFELASELFNANKNALEILDIIYNKVDELEIGIDSPLVKRQTKEVMENFFHAPYPIKWQTK